MSNPRPGRVLLVEDSARLRPLIVQLLESAGYEVFVAGDAESALRQVRELACDIDLLITDVLLPDHSGTDLVHAVRQRCQTLKVLLMSGFSFYAPEGTDFIEKPFSADELLTRARKILG